MYTHPDCSYSDDARNEFLQNDIPFREIDLSVTPEAWEEVERLTGGERITPVIVEGELVTVGFHGVG
jgi:glutaredoxin